MTFETKDSQRADLVQHLLDIKILLNENKEWIRNVYELIEKLSGEDGKTDE